MMFNFEEILKKSGVERDVSLDNDSNVDFVFFPKSDPIAINPKHETDTNVQDKPILKSNQSVKAMDIRKDTSFVSAISASCAICFENFLPYEGYTCNNRTSVDDEVCKIFTCWTCMKDHFQVACQSIENAGIINREGQILCCNPKCKTAITLERLYYTSAPMNVIKSQQELQYKIKLDYQIQLALSQQHAQIYAEYKRIEEINDQNEKIAAKLRHKIIEEVLTLKCPRCNQAFHDFDGCFALTCSNTHCRAGFCAWCLYDCGADAHSHVTTCSEHSTGSVHGTYDAFLVHHRKRKVKLTKIMIEDAHLNAISRRKLYEMLASDLRDLGISEYDIFPEQRNT